ncbi:SDR family oxidoreductase [Cronobacter sakazakii]|uniref:SDR family oxidoreductase n=1 Tax=Cronobacter sakazakii TaxID=28141 RepID=UPI002893B5D6|nr:SDR family oxidoreductase [Cronobacter sakazakii]EIZ9238515.1 SDR family oxidoreductase [Cronobacter sakazakii]ELY4184045.1 SDR family oxidoreductase [Cronobacter sakazakii]MDT3653174.1 SDR family oxidoreductase [Cronobacter sakazakii]
MTVQHILIIGASRGIGRGLANAIAQEGADVIATVRDATHKDTHPRITTQIVDMTDTASVVHLKEHLSAVTFDALIVNAGIFGPDHQSISQATEQEIATLFLTNAIAPVRLAETMLSQVREGGVIAFMSSSTASFTNNDTGDMALYRASKSALNSLARSFAVTSALPGKRSVLLLHPGWVQTDMGGERAPVTVDESAAGLKNVINAALDNLQCRFIDYRGQEIAP